MKRINALILSVLTSGFLVGCGGGGSSGGSSSTGTLIDNTISGVKYINGNNTGFTDKNGNFPYSSGLVEFYLGGIKLGELNSMTSDNKVFIQDLVGVERTNTSDAKVLKIANLLQSLDSDLTTDEIEISKTDFDKFASSTTSINDLDVDTLLKSNGFTSKKEADVKIHLENALKQHGHISDMEAPKLLSSSIENGTTGVSISPSIVLTFSENIPKEYINNQYFKLINDLDSSNVDMNIQSSGEIVTISPKNSLTYSQSYELIINSKLKDFAGNTLSNGGNTDIVIEFLVEEEIDTSSPIITSASSVSVDENQNVAFTISATDNSSNLTYSISGTDANLFNVNSVTGEITFKTAPDYETKKSYSIIVGVKDGSNNSSSKEITINIKDVYEPDTTAPVFKELTEDTGLHTSANENEITFSVTITATDDSPIIYSLNGTDASYFNIDSSTGEITFKAAPDYETKNFYEVSVIATDSFNNKAQSGIIGINIIDIYENTPPNAVAGPDSKIYYTENIKFDASNSTDNTGIVSYKWTENNTLLSDQISFVTSNLTIGVHNIKLEVTDDDGLTSTDDIAVTVFDSFTNILPMSEVGGVKSISSASINGNTTVTLGAGSKLYFKITNDMNRNFTVSSFEIKSYYNGYVTTRASSTDSSLLSGGTLNTNEFISLGYTLSSSQTANYWIGTYTLTDSNTGETFTNSFTWNGTRY